MSIDTSPLDEPTALSARLRRVWQQVRQAAQPGKRAWKGATWGVLAAAGLFWLFLIYAGAQATAPDLARWVVLVVILALSYLGGALVIAVLDLLQRLPRAFVLAVVMLVTIIGFNLASLSPAGFVLAFGLPIVGAALAGAGVAALRGDRQRLNRIQQVIAWGGLALGAALVVTIVGWLAWNGPAAEPPPNAAQTGQPAAALDLPDPSQPGPYTVRELFYGSGTDRHRPEFGPEVEIQTGTVDGSSFVTGWSGAVGWGRTRYWGFDLTALPLNGRVWMPSEPSEAPYPLVLVVHGNHSYDDFSDPGYAYLGEGLASRGFIVVSVDQNFLNGGPADIFAGPDGGLKEENDGRAWLLLEHLRQWREWNNLPEHPLSGLADLDRIALIGHSRGGEAVAVAAAFNRLPYYPDNARVAFDYDFGIRSVVAIAPIDGQYRPAEIGTPLEDVSYFSLQGTHDGDVRSFHGSRQYERVTFSPGRDDLFKSTLYIYGANHGQFNTTWGRTDFSLPSASFLNLTQIMPAAEQEQIARVFIPAFLEATLHDQTGYRALFRDFRSAADWLPDTIYLQQYQDSTYRYLATYEEDLDVTSLSQPGARAVAAGLSVWREQMVSIKWGPKDTRAVYLGWSEAGDDRRYTLEMSPGPDLPARSERSVLVFSLADANETPPGANLEGEKDMPRPPIDLSIELVDRSGAAARLPLSHVAALQPQLPGPVLKASFMNPTPIREAVFQSYEFPLSEFAAANAAFNPATLSEIRLVFDRSPYGVVILDGVGFYENASE